MQDSFYLMFLGFMETKMASDKKHERNRMLQEIACGAVKKITQSKHTETHISKQNTILSWGET